MAEIELHSAFDGAPDEPARDGRGRPRLDLLRAWYTVPELAAIACRSRWEMETELEKIEGLLKQPNGPGTLRRVYLSDLQGARRELYDSLLAMAAARARGLSD